MLSRNPVEAEIKIGLIEEEVSVSGNEQNTWSLLVIVPIFPEF
jgi:hypothetical protein